MAAKLSSAVGTFYECKARGLLRQPHSFFGCSYHEHDNTPACTNLFNGAGPLNNSAAASPDTDHNYAPMSDRVKLDNVEEGYLAYHNSTGKEADRISVFKVTEPKGKAREQRRTPCGHRSCMQ
jgi:hypothetical protein